ncbi:hypothetical protein E4U55_007317 [Claviceps digitariae]|nr:hypothetical protein E4U55_007317 [Claviceps digitariae]
MFELFKKDEDSGNLSPHEAQLLRDEVLNAALTNNSWLSVVVDTAYCLLAKYDFQWPDLYMKIMHHMLDNRRHEDTIRWHFRLAPKFLPSTDTFGAIVSSFILDPSPQEERRVTQTTDLGNGNSHSHMNHYNYSSKGQYSDSIVAKWFASSWISVDFAIHLAQKLGLRVMGPRSLQSLALREPGAKMLALRLARIEKLGITVSSKNYCKVLASFAKHEKDLLLADFLTCDIHPDEFDVVETRRMLMASSVRNRDWRRQRLLQGIEWAIESEPSPCRLNALLQRELATYKSGRARKVLDRMEALKVTINQQSASQLLMAAFREIGKHSAKRKRRGSKSRTRFQSLLNEAIAILRRVSLHNFAIPLRYWKLLLCNLGRSGRLDELQQLSEEIVQLYSPSSGGLVPISYEDLPRSWPEWNEATRRFSPDLTSRKNVSQDIKLRTEACVNGDCMMLCIPADLPMSHRHHPVQQIFDVTLQRSIVRWAFDQGLNMSSPCPSLERLTESGIAVCDINRGVLLLARLRDLGVLIDLQVLRAEVLSKIALGQVPGRKRNRSRDRHELSLERLKRFFDEAWGSEILPNTLEMRRQIDKQNPELWNRYSKLFEQSFDKRQNSSQEDMLASKGIS